MDPTIQILHDAAVENKVETLAQLIQQDPKVLEKASLSCEDKNPLHISAIFGNIEFVREVLRVCPEMCLAGDRFGRTPLHLAVIWGRLEVVEVLVQARPLAARERIAGAGGNVLHITDIRRGPPPHNSFLVSCSVHRSSYEQELTTLSPKIVPLPHLPKAHRQHCQC